MDAPRLTAETPTRPPHASRPDGRTIILTVRIDRRHARMAAILAAVLFVGAIAAYALAVNPSFETVIQPGSQVSTASYIVFTDGVNTFARNGRTGLIAQAAASAYSVIRNTMNTTGTEGGGLIVINRGTYSVNGQLYIGYPNVAVQGEGAGATILSFTASFTTDAVIAGANNVTVSDLRVLRAAGTGSGIEVVNCYGCVVRSVHIDGGGTGSGILIYGSTSPGSRFISVLNNYVQNTGRSGILVMGFASNVLISGNQVQTAGFSGIQMDPSIFTTTPGNLQNITVSGNHVSNFATASVSSAGIGMLRPGAGVARHIIISSNIVESQGHEGVNSVGIYSGYVSGFSGLTDLLINGNVVNGDPALFRGINVESPNYIYRWSNVVISNNIVNSSTIGIDVLYGNGVQIVGNRVTNTTNQGMYVGYMKGPSLISSNTVLNSGRGLASQYGIQIGTWNNQSMISNNIITDVQSVKTQQYGIYDWGSTGGSTIQFNNVTGNSIAGFGNLGTNTLVRWNIGYETEASGNASITGAVTTVTVSHGLVSTPVFVLVSPQQTGMGDWGITAKTATTFTITFVTQPGGSTWYFYWYAQTWNA